MKNKYFMIGGFAFSEESDMEKLKNYAKKGWILESIVGGFFYKLKKDKPKDIEYSLDYQNEASDEYFNIFLEAGWKHVLSMGNEIHIFSAEEGTKPIYSDRESEIDKYTRIKKQMGKGSIYSLVSSIILGILLVISLKFFRPIFLVILVLFLVSIVVFIFSFMPFCAYSFRLNQLWKNDNNNSKVTPSKVVWKLYFVVGIIFIFLGIIRLVEKKNFGVVFILIGAFNAYVGLSSSKE